MYINIILSLLQDWHCPDHVSFAASHAGKKEFEEIDLQYDKSGTLEYESINNIYFNLKVSQH